MFDKILIANRGAIACRIIRTLKTMGINSVAIYSDPDAESLHVQQADEAIALHGSLASETYLNIEKVIAAALSTGAKAIHPGYGFLSENTHFAHRCEEKGIVFIGPTASQIEQFGLKHTARELAKTNNVPLIPGSDLLADLPAATTAAADVGYPIMLKSTAGGGGIGMQVCWNIEELTEAFERVKRLSKNNFGNDGVFLEKYIAQGRHIEVQIVGDGHGYVVALGERDCSLQRRNQKVIEETPAPHLANTIRDDMVKAAIRLAAAVNYRSAGTVEYIYDIEAKAFYFLEMNTRLQVEHGITEMVTGVDLVRWMIEVAAENYESVRAYVHQPSGHAIQTRIYAEDPGKQFQPSSGLLTQVKWPTALRCDSAVETGLRVPAFYDPMLAKVIAYQETREAAIGALIEGLSHTRLEGIETNRHYLEQVLLNDQIQAGEYDTGFLNRFAYHGSGIDVIKPGTQTTVQDYPGRVGYWDIGVPPSGPMDHLAFQLGNRILGNPAKTAGLEITLTGPTLSFRCDTVIALTGAAMDAKLLDATQTEIPMSFWEPISITAGSVLQLGSLSTAGMRTYLCIKGGLQIEDYLGSKSTFTLGLFGGHSGRALQVGDVLPIQASQLAGDEHKLQAADIPTYTHTWEISVLYGPHGAPDFFTKSDISTFFETQWEVHFNSSRTGVRLIGPKPDWAREDGGEAGLHPSNIHDNAYAIGAVDFTGDMPVILGPDGPSLGGFVCPVTIIKADLWKMGQLKPGDTIRFVPVDYDLAVQQEQLQKRWVEQLKQPSPSLTSQKKTVPSLNPLLCSLPATAHTPAVIYRVSGDDNILIEYGPLELDLTLRFRVHALMLWLQQHNLASIIDLTPGIRSLQVHYDNLQLSQQALLMLLHKAESELGDVANMSVPTRTVYLPLSWDDEATRLAIEKYMTTVNPDAPWCPSNIEFIRRINALESIDAVKKIVFDASYLVMGLGDVYLGAPVATPLDPRHRLVTTKYNPARTWTPENAVGIGGAYMCVYGMEGPGGYQFVGRTLQMWNRHRQTTEFTQPWLLRFFDQIRFYEVSQEELKQIRKDFPLGRYPLRIEESEFKLADYQQFLEDNATSISQFRSQQRQAFAEERARWKEKGLAFEPVEADLIESDDIVLADNETAIHANVPGSIWQIVVKPGDRVEAGDTVAIIESMKMEFPVTSDVAGTIKSIVVSEGQQINAGQMMLTVEN